MSIKASIVGANGYTGLELINILLNHKDVELSMLVSRSNVGTKVADMYPSLLSRLKDVEFTDIDVEALAKNSDVVFLGLPHGASATLGGELHDRGVRVIDLSADFRYDNLETYSKWYKIEHPRPELNPKAVYGLPELYRNDIKKANLIANPGCYTTASILALYPLLDAKIIDTKHIIIDAKSGTSGAGRKGDVPQIFAEVSENFKAYGVSTHRHTSEIEEQLSKASGNDIILSFTPHLLPTKRGIFATIYADLNGSAKDVVQAYAKFYAKEQFVTVLPEGSLPELKNVVGSNNCQIGFKIDARLNRIIIISCIDNLVKGASGQAVQNMNIMFNLPEDTGLQMMARYL